MTSRLITLLLFCSVTLCLADGKYKISGQIEFNKKIKAPIVVQLYQLHQTERGLVIPLSKRDIYGEKSPDNVKKLTNNTRFQFSDLTAGYYTIVAFVDNNKNNQLDFAPPEPLGWIANEIGGGSQKIDLTKTDQQDLTLYLRLPTPFPRQEKQTDHGRLHWLKGLPVLQLWGTPAQRGYAHGFLIGRQIVDFFEFYILEDSWKSPQRYKKVFEPFLENNFNYPEEFLQECDGVISGMKAAKTELFIPALGRDFNRTDLFAINAYIERRAAYPVSPASSCSQFSFWGESTEGTSLNGGLIAARNMDGECDIRKVTVSHFLVFAVDPERKDRHRWISTMWPGFVGTISGINEKGLYSMENAGGTGPGPVVDGIVPCSWTQRFLLETADEKATSQSVLQAMKLFTNNGGGITSPGSIILWAVPFSGQTAPAFVYEGDRFGGQMRLPGQARPKIKNGIMATNHYRLYGFDPNKPKKVFNKSVSFSSEWRYEVGMNTIEAWKRQNKKVDLPDVKNLLQMVAHGSTEYSVIFLANKHKILIAVDDLETDLWDAPYQSWKEFEFEELFIKK